MTRWLACVAMALGLASCSYVGYPAGVTLTDDTPTFVLKPCDHTTVIGRAALRQSDSEDQPPKWEARLDREAGGGQDVPLAASVPGYTITGELGATSLVPDNYYFVELYDQHDEFRAALSFKGSDPVEGKIFLYGDVDFGEATYADPIEWEEDTSDCPGNAEAEVRTVLRGVAIGGAIVVLIGVAIAVVATVSSRRKRARIGATPPTISAATRPCPNGHPVSVSNRFCRVCGARVDENAPTP